jgi:alpha-tubulin suppressor-like RCC1 family protein
MNGSVYASLTLIDVPHPLRCLQIACGRKHILALMEGGYVLSWGTGYLGQLGLGDDSSWDTPRMIRHLDPKRLGDVVKSVVCGGSHSGVMTKSGKIYMWGLNRNGQTGTGLKVESVLEPRPIDPTDVGKKNPISLICGRNHTLLLTSEGRVFSWGAGGAGRLGLTENRKNQYTPLEIQFFRSRPAKKIQCGDFHNVALGVDGFIYTWGYNLEGQCGNGGTMNQKIPKRIEFPFDLWGDSCVAEGKEILEISCGSSWSNVITSSGIVYTWGYGDGGWLGLEPLMKNVPYIESEFPSPPHTDLTHDPKIFYQTASSRSFDSNLNLLRPLPVTHFIQRNYRVKWIRNGGGHVIYCVEYDESMAVRSRNQYPDEAKIFGSHSHSDSSSLFERDSKCSVKESSHVMVAATQQLQQSTTATFIQTFDGQFGYTSHTTNTTMVLSSNSSSTPLADSSSMATFMSWIRHNKVPEIHRALVSEGSIDLTEKDENGNTALHIACQNGHLNICKILLEHCCTTTEDSSLTKTQLINEKNNKGNTALHYSIAYGYRAISDYLIVHGADEYVTNLEGLTCYEGLKREDLEKL